MLEIIRGDITKQSVDAIVNAANSSLMGGGGVDGAIHRAGGGAILEACRAIRRDTLPNGLATGDAIATTAGKLLAKWVIHTVAPIWQGGNQGEPELMASAYRRSLEVALEVGAKSVAIPSLGTGVYGNPVSVAAPIALGEINKVLALHPDLTVRMVLFSEADERAYRSAWNQLQG
jgi:O-acetyl-ADP-ribose deacetylase